jgi:transketolase
MRIEFCRAMLSHINLNDKIVFLTGDLGFMAFEEMQKHMGDRFINMGVSEQNMISVSASLAHEGFIPFVYSIAPFLVARPFEQIRNEIGLHDQPVKLVANGGGFGYGIMGATHHCLEDISLMRSVPNMTLFLPTYLEDVEEAIDLMLGNNKPSYLRLNSSKNRELSILPFSYFRNIRKGKTAVVIGAGPVMLNVIECNAGQNLDLEIWLIDQIPINEFPGELLDVIKRTKKLIIVEEHYQAGGIGEMLTVYLHANRLISPSDMVDFDYLCVHGYLSGKYGDQKWHLSENNLFGDELNSALRSIISN